MNKQLADLIEVLDGPPGFAADLERLIDQYAYEYAERVIDQKESYDQNDPIGNTERMIRNSHRDELHKTNQELSPHRGKKEQHERI